MGGRRIQFRRRAWKTTLLGDISIECSSIKSDAFYPENDPQEANIHKRTHTQTAVVIFGQLLFLVFSISIEAKTDIFVCHHYAFVRTFFSSTACSPRYGQRVGMAQKEMGRYRGDDIG